MVSFTWSIQTFEGSKEIANALAATVPVAKPQTWRAVGDPVVGPGGELESWLSFETAAGAGEAHVRIDEAGKAVTLATSLLELKGRPFATGRRRALGHPVDSVSDIAQPRRNRRYWHERRAAALPRSLGGEAPEPYVLIIGGGQAGLSLGARLRLLGIPYVIVEKHARVGDSWRSRYPGLLLHDPVWYDHLPYIPFPESWPVFTPRDKIADWLEMYASAMDLDVCVSTAVERALPPDEARHGEGDGRWEVRLRRSEGATAGGLAPERVVVHPTHVVFATGMSGYPRVPAPPGEFGGEVLHSSSYAGAAGGAYAGIGGRMPGGFQGCPMACGGGME